MATVSGHHGRVQPRIDEGVAEGRLDHPAKRSCFSLELAGDLRVVGEGAETWWPAIEYGIAPLSRLVSLAADIGGLRALELLLLGESGSTTTTAARGLGLVNRLLPSRAVDETAREMAGLIADYDREHDVAADLLAALYHARREGRGASAVHATRQRHQRERERRTCGLD